MVKSGSPAVLLPWHRALEHFRVHGRSWLPTGQVSRENLQKKIWHLAHQDRGEFLSSGGKNTSLPKRVDVSGTMTGSQVGFEVASVIAK